MSMCSKKKKTIGIIIATLLTVTTVIIIGFTSGLFSIISIEWHNAYYGNVTLDNGVYVGETHWGEFTGSGKFTFESGIVCDGDWQNFQMTGHGAILFPNLGTYSGELKNSLKSGEGIFEWNNGDKYVGSFAYDEINGTGCYCFSDGSKVEGEFRNNAFVEGTYTYESTEKCIVTYKNGKAIKANIEFGDGTIFDGEIQNNLIHGNGKITFINEDSYNGSFSCGKRHGTGKYIWKNGDIYEGDWKEDKMSGKGTYSFSNSETIDGIFENNKFINGTYSISQEADTYIYKMSNDIINGIIIKLDNGFSYDGDYVNEELTGKATIVYPSGDTYAGDVINGKRNGSGTYTWNDTSKYEGDWDNDKMNGTGTYYYKESSKGYKLSGVFQDNLPSGICEYYSSSTSTTYYGTTWENGQCVKITEYRTYE